MISKARLRESVVAFFFAGVFIGACFGSLSKYATLGMCLVSGVSVCVCAWRLQSLNIKEHPMPPRRLTDEERQTVYRAIEREMQKAR